MLGELRMLPSTAVLVLHGELDIVTADDLRQLLDKACAHDSAAVVIDLSDVPFIDVLSLSAMLATADSLRERGGNLTVTGASSSVRRVCSLLNADDVLAPVIPGPRLVLQ